MNEMKQHLQNKQKKQSKRQNEQHSNNKEQEVKTRKLKDPKGIVYCYELRYCNEKTSQMHYPTTQGHRGGTKK